MAQTSPPRAEIELGVHSLTDVRAGGRLEERIRDIVDYGVAAERAGLDAFGVGEHHTARFAVPSPAVPGGLPRAEVLASIARLASTLPHTKN
jgi:alkanesulfonate monooxygenase SsuD/methylene tetrahydromethanopterin reductase-like flavin-dependent oxidoreductase (luciferase family)